MTYKRLFVGRKTVEDRFTIITDYDGEIGVKENRSGEVLVLKHSDLNAQQFVAQLVLFLNDQNQAIVDLFDGSKYWSDKATEKIKELEKENKQLKIRFNEERERALKFGRNIDTLTVENEELQVRNDRQAKQLDNLYTLIEKQDWKTLKGLIQEFQECEEQLQREWRTYE